MAEPFLTEIRLMSFGFAPKGWALCNGQLLPINQNQALFALIGTLYGGNGQVNFALPDFRGRVPIHAGNGHSFGERGGAQAHTLSISELPTHSHPVQVADERATGSAPSNAALAPATTSAYGPPHDLTALHSATVSNVGASQAHLNMQPFLTLSFCIALQGIFPSQN